MVALADITGATREVELQGQKFPVPGISVRGMATLSIRFPIFADMLAGKGIELSAEQVLQIPDMCAAVIAAGMGYPGDEELERKIVNWNVSMQFACLNAIYDATLSEGIRPIEALTGKLRAHSGSRGKAPGTSSPKP
jgi:hypothetical protein